MFLTGRCGCSGATRKSCLSDGSSLAMAASFVTKSLPYAYDHSCLLMPSVLGGPVPGRSLRPTASLPDWLVFHQLKALLSAG